jgi:hypothetical protein
MRKDNFGRKNVTQSLKFLEVNSSYLASSHLSTASIFAHEPISLFLRYFPFSQSRGHQSYFRKILFFSISIDIGFFDQSARAITKSSKYRFTHFYHLLIGTISEQI